MSELLANMEEMSVMLYGVRLTKVKNTNCFDVKEVDLR